MSRTGGLIGKQLDYLFNPRSVAVIGASGNPGKWGFGTFDTVRRTARDINSTYR